MEKQANSIREIINEYISLSKFAKCIGISRPTLYKYVDAYDKKCLDLIPDNVLKVFDTASSGISRNNLQTYFNDMYVNYICTEERRSRENPVPSDIAEIVDSENLNVKDIDNMIERAESHLKRLMKRADSDEDEIEQVKKDICDLRYTREMVERRLAENRFVLIYNADWTSCIGSGESDTIDFDDEAEIDVPDIETKFRFYLTRAKAGYTLFFYNDEEGDFIELQLLTGAGEDRAKDVVGTFYPENGMKYICVPDLFDEDFEDLFRYRVLRSRNGVILNAAIGKFTV